MRKRKKPGGAEGGGGIARGSSGFKGLICLKHECNKRMLIIYQILAKQSTDWSITMTATCMAVESKSSEARDVGAKQQ